MMIWLARAAVIYLLAGAMLLAGCGDYASPPDNRCVAFCRGRGGVSHQVGNLCQCGDVLTVDLDAKGGAA